MLFSYEEMKKGMEFKKFGFEIEGDTSIGGNNVPLVITKIRGSDEGTITIKAEKLKVKDFISKFNKDTDKESSSADIQMFMDAVIKDPTISGLLSLLFALVVFLHL